MFSFSLSEDQAVMSVVSTLKCALMISRYVSLKPLGSVLKDSFMFCCFVVFFFHLLQNTTKIMLTIISDQLM